MRFGLLLLDMGGVEPVSLFEVQVMSDPRSLWSASSLWSLTAAAHAIPMRNASPAEGVTCDSQPVLTSYTRPRGRRYLCVSPLLL